MIKKALFLSLLGALCLGTALAGTNRQVVFKLNGSMPGAYLTTDIPGQPAGSFLYVNLGITQLNNGSLVILADIQWSEDGGNTVHEIFGPVPSNVLTGGRGGPLKLNITYNSFIDLQPPYVDDPDFSGLEGTFTAYTGPGGGSFSNSGTYRNTYTHLDGSVETNITNGTITGQAAGFEGILYVSGTSYNISVPGSSYSADTHMQKGIITDIITTPTH